MPSGLLHAAALASLLLVSGCAASTRPPPNAGGGAGQSSNQLITAEQIERSKARTMWDALRYTVPSIARGESARNKPSRVSTRGSSSIAMRDELRIYVDGIPLSDPGLLGMLPASDILSIEVLNGVDATTRYGTGSGDGVILIRTRGGSKDDNE